MSVFDRLNQKVDELLCTLSELNNEIAILKNENSNLLNEIKDKDVRINSLYEELSNIDRSYEDIISKIDEAQKQVDSRFEFYLSSRKIKIDINNINANAKEEIESFLSQKNLDIKDILRAYIQKSQDHAELEIKIEKLIDKLDSN